VKKDFEFYAVDEGYFLLGEYEQYKDEIDRMVKLKEWINDYEKDLKEFREIVKAIPSDLEYFAKYRPSEFESRKKEAVRDFREYVEIKKSLKSLKDELRMLREKLSLKLKREIK
jgi:tetratricopeptide (TPR) repeat protein